MVVRMWRKGNPCASLVGMEMGAAIMENSMEVPEKIENRTNIWSSNSISGYLPEENENTTAKRYLHPFVHWSIIYNSHNMETT